MREIRDLDPATGEVLAVLPAATSEEIQGAVARARGSQSAWAALSLEERTEKLLAGLGRVTERADELARLVTQEMGKRFEDARFEVKSAAKSGGHVLRDVARAVEPDVHRSRGHETRVERHPLGVVATITPWNYPVLMPLEILVPALGTGNAVVFKPSEHVPLTGALLAECLNEHLPAGVLCPLQGAGDVGAELVAADVDLVGFVGSRATGKRIMESASQGLKRLVLELGGKDPLVVFADADLEAAADCVVTHALENTGQVCSSVERIYVADEVAGPFEELVLERARKWTHGSGFDEAASMGPMVSEEQRAKVIAQVEDARACGVRVLLGGETPEGPGWFYPATVLADVGEELALSREETFGPVIALSRFDGDEEEAVRLANDSPYGLGANVFTADLERGRRVAGRIRSGQVGVNRFLAATPKAPWVGAGESGFGFLGGVDGHRQFTIPKSISYPVED